MAQKSGVGQDGPKASLEIVQNWAGLAIYNPYPILVQTAVEDCDPYNGKLLTTIDKKDEPKTVFIDADQGKEFKFSTFWISEACRGPSGYCRYVGCSSEAAFLPKSGESYKAIFTLNGEMCRIDLLRKQHDASNTVTYVKESSKRDYFVDCAAINQKRAPSPRSTPIRPRDH